jgi:hypothetical protein
MIAYCPFYDMIPVKAEFFDSTGSEQLPVKMDG